MVYRMYIQHSLEIKSPWNWLDLLPRTRVCWYVLLTVSINNRTRSGIYKHWYISHSRICLLYPEVNLQTPLAQGHKGTEMRCTEPLACCPLGKGRQTLRNGPRLPQWHIPESCVPFNCSFSKKIIFFTMFSYNFIHIKNTFPEGPNVKIVVLYWLCKFHKCIISLLSTLVLSPYDDTGSVCRFVLNTSSKEAFQVTILNSSSRKYLGCISWDPEYERTTGTLNCKLPDVLHAYISQIAFVTSNC